MLTLSDSKQNKLTYILFIMYSSVYIAKLNYNALLVEILADLGGPRSTAGLVGSFFFFSYGIGQVVNGFLAKHMNEKYFMTAALLGSSICNIAMTFAPNVGVMKYIWLINGIMMSPLWCNVVKVQGKYISGKNLPKSLMLTGLTTPIGTALNYGICALVVQFFTWRMSFWVAGVVMAFMAVLWFVTLGDIERCAGPEINPESALDQKSSDEKSADGSIAKKIGFGVLAGLAAMFIAGMFTQFAREGLNSWVPSILKEVYLVPATLSIALTLLIPLLSSMSNFVLVTLEKKCKDFLILSIVFIGTATLFSGVLIATHSLNSAIITMVCFIIISACCAGVASITTNHIPLYYRDRFDTGSMAGIGQGFCYIGSTLSTYTMGYVADKGGWFSVFALIGIVIGFALLLCVLVKLFTKERHHHPRFIHH